MKKNLILALAAMACLLASCQKPELNIRIKQVKDPIVFTATIDNGTKTAINGSTGKVTWVAGDRITVKCGEQTGVYEAASTGATTDFTYVSGTVFDDESATYSATYGDIDNQIYSAAGANCPLAAPEKAGKAFTFTASAAMLKLNVKADGVTVTQVLAAGKTLDCGAGVTLNTATGTDFYIAIPAGTYEKLTFTFVAEDGRTCTKKLKNAKTLAANELLPITLSTALEFSSVTYYNLTMITSENPTGATTEENKSFSVVGSWDNSNRISLTDVNFANGDAVEMCVSEINGSNVFIMGGPEGFNLTSTDDAVISVGGASPNWSNLNVNAGANIEGTSGARQIYPDPPAATVNLMYILVDRTGLWYKQAEDASFTRILLSNDPYVKRVLARGSVSNPLYLGHYDSSGSGNFKYIKVTRGNTPVLPIAVTGVSLDKTSATLFLGSAGLTLNAIVEPEDAGNKAVTWTSSNESVATVSSEGHVTAIAEGNATITATTVDGNFTASCSVTVHEDNDELITGNTIYLSRFGKKHNDPQSFDVTAESGYEISIPVGNGTDDLLNWTAGDILEISIAGGNGYTGNIVYIGDKNHINNSDWNYYNLSMTYANETGWWSIVSHSDIKLNNRVQSEGDVEGIVKLLASEMWFYGDEFNETEHSFTGVGWHQYEFTDGENGSRQILANIQSLDTLYIMTRASEHPVGHINYIRITKSGATP